MKYVTKIISGAQTGADRAGIDAAIELGLDWGGYVPRGFRSEEPTGVPEKYRPKLIQTAQDTWTPRTKLNVQHADATIVFTGASGLGRGSESTIEYAIRYEKFHKHVDLKDTSTDWPVDIRGWLIHIGEQIANRSTRPHPVVLNVAGSRESTTPGIYTATLSIPLCALR